MPPETIAVDVAFEERYWYPDDGGVVWLAGYQVVDPASGRWLGRDDPEIARRAALLALDDRGPRGARVERRRELRRDLARHPSDLCPARGVDGDRAGVVRVLGVAAQVERPPGADVLGGERVGVVAARAGDADDA